MTCRYKFQREMARVQRRQLLRRATFRAHAASAVLAAVGLVVL
jgi:hypothetical protein